MHSGWVITDDVLCLGVAYSDCRNVFASWVSLNVCTRNQLSENCILFGDLIQHKFSLNPTYVSAVSEAKCPAYKTDDIWGANFISVSRVFDLMHVETVWDNHNFHVRCTTVYCRGEVPSPNGLGDPTPTDAVERLTGRD